MPAKGRFKKHYEFLYRFSNVIQNTASRSLSGLPPAQAPVPCMTVYNVASPPQEATRGVLSLLRL